MKKLNLLGLSVVTIGLLVGCGSSNTDGSGVDTGTGYYVDSAVEGVDYVCGSKSGTTDPDGKFTFEVGKDCSFSLAGVSLRSTKADDLKDGLKVLEDDESVAQFLQSIDNDNNASNGIQIDSAILEVLTQALADYSAGKVPTDTALDNVVTRVKNDVPTFEGRVKTPEEVTAHLTQTQTEITKALFAGKTFYLAYNDEGIDTIEKLTFNKDVTSVLDKVILGNGNSGTLSVKIDGKKMITSGEKTVKIIREATDKYIRVAHQGTSESDSLLFYNEADAKATFDSSSATTTPSSTLSDLIVGKTYYVTLENNAKITNK